MENIHIIRSLSNEETIIELRSDGIIRIVFLEKTVFDISHQEKLLANFIQIAEGEKYPVLYEAFDDVTFTKAARENSIKLESISPSLASAAVARSLPYRLMANFYLKIQKPKIPFRIFSNDVDAIKWLYTFKETK